MRKFLIIGFAAVALFFFFLTRNDAPPPPELSTAMVPVGENPNPNVTPPPGMELAKGHIEHVGKELYTYKGDLFGTVTDADLNHKFPDGSTVSALRIRLANQPTDELGAWMVREVVTSNYYVKK